MLTSMSEIIKKILYRIHSAPGDYKPEWIGDAENCTGYNSSGFASPVYDEILKFMQDKENFQDYLVEVSLKITKIEEKKTISEAEY